MCGAGADVAGGERALRKSGARACGSLEEEAARAKEAAHAVAGLQAAAARALDSSAAAARATEDLSQALAAYAAALAADAADGSAPDAAVQAALESAGDAAATLQQLHRLELDTTVQLERKVAAPLDTLVKGELAAAAGVRRQARRTAHGEARAQLAAVNDKCDHQAMKSMCEANEALLDASGRGHRLLREALPAVVRRRAALAQQAALDAAQFVLGARLQHSPDEALRQGPLEKKGGKRRNWNLRWFVLRRGFLLYCTAAEGELKGVVRLAGCRVERAANRRKPHCFAVHTPLRTYLISAADERDLVAWTTAIRDAAAAADLEAARALQALQAHAPTPPEPAPLFA